MGAPDPARYIYLYTGSAKEKQHFVKLAEDAGVPLSKFILSKVEEALARKPPSRANAREIEDLRAKVAKLQADVKQKDMELEHIKALLSRQQDLAWLDDSAEVLQINFRLIEEIKDHGPIHDASLLEAMGVASTDLAMIGAISSQLELLEKHGRILKGARGWRWVGKQ
jgi:hypothetical protein